MRRPIEDRFDELQELGVKDWDVHHDCVGNDNYGSIVASHAIPYDGGVEFVLSVPTEFYVSNKREKLMRENLISILAQLNPGVSELFVDDPHKSIYVQTHVILYQGRRYIFNLPDESYLSVSKQDLMSD